MSVFLLLAPVRLGLILNMRGFCEVLEVCAMGWILNMRGFCEVLKSLCNVEYVWGAVFGPLKEITFRPLEYDL